MRRPLTLLALLPLAAQAAPSDQDWDRLPDLAEVFTGTDPFDADSDGGGLTDGLEILLGSNPNSALDDLIAGDNDGDGLDDANESPLNPFTGVIAVPPTLDSDFDGSIFTSDGAESALFTDADNWDTDGDRISDSTELLLGCNPSDPRDVLGSPPT